jgi:branched-subunit amino acid transport protein AzlD
MSLLDALIAIAAMSAVTFLLRAIPFLFFQRRQPPRALTFIRDFIPPAVMTVLVLASFKDIHWTKVPFGTPELLSAVVVALLHFWRGNALISIFGGTAFYMIIARTGVLSTLLGG